jgi:hypothetical protein
MDRTTDLLSAYTYNLNLFGCDSPKLASSRFRVIFSLIPRSLLRGGFILRSTAG